MKGNIKEYPLDYDPDAVEILEKMKFPNSQIVIVGTGSLSTSIYPGDIDAMCVHKITKNTASLFQKIVKEIDKQKGVYLGDIKIGSIPEWNVVPTLEIQRIKNGEYKILNWNEEEILSNLENVPISGKEKEKAMRMIKKANDPETKLECENELRFGVLRWTPDEIANGEKKLINGKTITLQEAWELPGRKKLDSIGWTEGESRTTEITMVYMDVNDEKPSKMKFLNELEQEYYRMCIRENWMKAVKRLYSYSRLKGNKEIVKELELFLNSGVGLAYQVLGNAEALLYLEENYSRLPKEKVEYEIRMFRVRLTAFQETFRNKTMNGIISRLLDADTKKMSIRELKKLIDELSDIINGYAFEYLEKKKRRYDSLFSLS